MGEIKLSAKECKVIETIRKVGKWVPPNAQNATAKNLIKKNICDWNSGYDALILTRHGQSIDL